MRKHRSPRNRVPKRVPPHNTGDTDSPSHPDTDSPSHPDTDSPSHPDTDSPSHPDTDSPSHPDTFSPSEALQSLHIQITDLEAIAHAANEAVVELPAPSDREERRPYNRVYTLVTKVAEDTSTMVHNSGQMMDALAAYLKRKRAGQ